MGVRIPQLPDIGKAIELYYSRLELNNQDISKLFGTNTSRTICGLKKIAKAAMLENNVNYYDTLRVNTKVAYKVWGLDIDDLERRYAKLKKMGLIDDPKSTYEKKE